MAPGQVFFTAEQERDVVARYRAGATYKEIAAAYGCSTKPVWKALARHDVAPRTGRAFTDEQEKVLADRYRAGASYTELATETGVTHGTIKKMLARQGVDSRSRGGRMRAFTDEEVQDVARRWGAGESQHSIGLSLGLSQDQVSRMFAMRGIVREDRAARGPRHGMWRGGRITMGEGYAYVRPAPTDALAQEMSTVSGYVAEHRLVMARALGRALTEHETVHHINGDKQDNRLENLQLRQGKHGKGVSARCACCGSRDVIFDELR